MDPKIVFPGQSEVGKSGVGISSTVPQTPPPPGFTFDQATGTWVPTPTAEPVKPNVPPPPPGFVFDSVKGTWVPAPVSGLASAKSEPAVVVAPSPSVGNGSDEKSSFVQEADFQSSDIKSQEYDFYAGKKGRTDRLALPFPRVKYVNVHYLNGYFVCQTPPGGPISECCQELGMPSQRVGTVVFKYATDRQGNVKRPISIEVLPWVFGSDKYAQIKSFDGDFPVASNDIKVTCTEEHYQRLTIAPAAGQLWKEAPDLDRAMLEAKNIWDKLERFLARRISRAEMLDRLGRSETIPEGDAQGIDFEAVTNVG